MTIFSGDYEQRIIRRIRISWACYKLSDRDIISVLWEVYIHNQQYPDGIPHHELIDEPEDDWFISRVADKLGISGLREK